MKTVTSITSEDETQERITTEENILGEDDNHTSSFSNGSYADDSSRDEILEAVNRGLVVDISTRRTSGRTSPSKRNQKRTGQAAHSKAHRHLITRHEYHDHALDPIDAVGVGSPSCRGTVVNGTTPFPTKLYEMINEIDNQGFAEVVSWQPHGRCFKVHDVSTFKVLLQSYFKLSKLASFQRQLNLYGFQRLTVGLDKGSYYHELFLRSRPDLVRRIDRVKVKGTGVRAKANPDDEPNLYSYPAIDSRAELVIIGSTTPLSSINLQEQANDEPGVLAGAKWDAGSMPLYNDMDSNFSNAQACLNTEVTANINNDDAPSNVSFGSVTLDKPCSIMTGLVRNLSSLNVFPSKANLLSTHSWRSPNMQNATFPIPATSHNPTILSSNYLRNVSSCVLNNNSSFASMLTDDVATTSRTYDVELHQTKQQAFAMDKLGINKNATTAVENLSATNETDDNVNFDKLVDEMFQHNQTIDFPDLIKMAMEANEEPAV